LSVLCKESDYRISFKVKLPQERFSGINEWSAARLTSNKENYVILEKNFSFIKQAMKKDKITMEYTWDINL
jgi:hypothetical protein